MQWVCVTNTFPAFPGSQCTGLFSTTVLGGSSSAPNLQDYARSHGKKFASSLTYKDGMCVPWQQGGTLWTLVSQDAPVAQTGTAENGDS